MSSRLGELVLAESTLIPVGPNDRYFDYCLQPYRPRRPPHGKLRAESILWQTLEGAPGAEALRPPLVAIQEALGRDMTVWGVKHAAGRLWWELYFYDPRKEDPAASVAGLAQTLAPFVTLRPEVRETTPYMMVSLDLSPDTLARGSIDEVNLYLTGTDEHAGRSYKARGDGTLELDNTYRFMEPKRDVDTVVSLIESSAFVDYADPRTLASVLLPRLFACKRVCVAKKRRCDAIYYSGIDVDQLLWFLRRFAYPTAIVDFVAEHRARFDHLYFDVGVDYAQDASGAVRYPKTSFYGTL